MIKYAAGFLIGYNKWGLCSVVEINQKVPIATNLLASYGCGRITSSTEDVALVVQHTTWFMLDGALPHVTCILKQFVVSHYSY